MKMLTEFYMGVLDFAGEDRLTSIHKFGVTYDRPCCDYALLSASATAAPDHQRLRK